MEKKYSKGKVVRLNLCGCDPNHSFFNDNIKIGHVYEKFDVSRISYTQVECQNCKKVFGTVMVSENTYGSGFGLIPAKLVEIEGFNLSDIHPLKELYLEYKEAHAGNHDNTETAFMAGAIKIMQKIAEGHEALERGENMEDISLQLRQWDAELQAFVFMQCIEGEDAEGIKSFIEDFITGSVKSPKHNQDEDSSFSM